MRKRSVSETGTASKSRSKSTGNGTSHVVSTTPTTSDETAAQNGLALVQRGNEYFFSDCYLEATGYYYQAAMLLKHSKNYNVQRSKAWSNVAECHLRLKNWQAAEDASTNAIAADPSNLKALYRRAKARFELGNYHAAAKDADAVGTQDAQDVADLCRELAKEISFSSTSGRSAISSSRNSSGTGGPVVAERSIWFRRIIDSYRLRVDDEYTQTGASDSGNLYGLRTRGAKNPPIDHFKAYVRRALKKRVLPSWFIPKDMDDLCQMAMNDEFSNINSSVLPEEIVDFYYAKRGTRNELKNLRDLATYIEGPIGLPWDENLKKKRGQEIYTNAPRVIAEPSVRRTQDDLESVEKKHYPSNPGRHCHRLDYADPALMDKNDPHPCTPPYHGVWGKPSSRSINCRHPSATTSEHYCSSDGSQWFSRSRTHSYQCSHTPMSSKRSSMSAMRDAHREQREQSLQYSENPYLRSHVRQNLSGGRVPTTAHATEERQEHSVSHAAMAADEQSGSYGPQLPLPYDDKPIEKMAPSTYAPAVPQQYYDRRDDNDEVRDDTSTAQEVRHGYRDFEEQILSDLTGLSP